MDFFEKIGETIISKGKDVGDKAKEVAEIASLKNQIRVCEGVIKKNYAEIGKAYYQENADLENNPYEKQCTAIKNAEKGIADLEEKIRAMKGV